MQSSGQSHFRPEDFLKSLSVDSCGTDSAPDLSGHHKSRLVGRAHRRLRAHQAGGLDAEGRYLAQSASDQHGRAPGRRLPARTLRLDVGLSGRAARVRCAGDRGDGWRIPRAATNSGINTVNIQFR